MISGDVETASVREQVERHFGQISSRPLPKRPQWKEPPRNADSLVALSHPARETTVLVTALHRAERRLGDTEQVHALEVLSEILSGGTTGRFYRRLVVEQALAVHTGSWYSSDNRGPGFLAFMAHHDPARHSMKSKPPSKPRSRTY